MLQRTTRWLDQTLNQPLERTLQRWLHNNWLYYLLAALLLVWMAAVLLRFNQMVVLVPAVIMALLVVVQMGAHVVWLVGAVAMPLSLQLDDLGPIGISLPSDVISIGLLFLIILKAKAVGQTLRKVGKHPLFIAVMLFWLWMGVCIIPSSMPLISFKYWLSTTWFVGGFFVFSLTVFERYPRFMQLWLWASIPTLGVVLLYTVLRHSTSGFGFLESYRVMMPFFREHTAYAGSIAIYCVAFGILGLGQRKWSRGWWWAGAATGLVLFAVITSYTRGAWLGLLVAGGVWFTVKYWKWMRYVLVGVIGLVGLGLSVALSQDLSDKESNAEERSILSHFRTAFDTQENTSNKERLNRWVAAREMILERPWMGFGPGTYAFQYAPYQKAEYRTYVSTNQGNIGTTHNEFLLAGSEMGLPGMVWVGAVYVISLITAIRGYRRARSLWRRTGYGIALTGMLTFYAHAFVNNFMDQDKVSIPLFTLWAMIIALDLLHPEPTTQEKL
jgi:O-antigen ligase